MTKENLVLFIQNFQRIEKAQLEFVPGINIITGPSNSGKSAIMRAFNVAMLNQSRPDTVRFGADFSVVGVRFNGHEVIYRRDTSGASPVKYRVDGTVLSKVGRGPVEEVCRAIGIQEVEADGDKLLLFYQKQMKYPFLLDKTGAQLFKFVAGASGEERVLDVVSQMKKDYSKRAQEVVRMEGRRDALKDQAARLKKDFARVQPKLESCNKVLETDSKVHHFTDVGLSVATVRTASEHLSGLEKVLEVERSQFAICESYQTQMGSLMEKVDQVNLQVAGIQASKTQVDRVSGDLAIQSDTLSGYEKKIPTLQALLESIESLQKKRGEVVEYCKAISVVREAVIKQDQGVKGYCEQLNQVETEISTIPVCPYCGNSLTKEHSHE